MDAQGASTRAADESGARGSVGRDLRDGEEHRGRRRRGVHFVFSRYIHVDREWDFLKYY